MYDKHRIIPIFLYKTNPCKKRRYKKYFTTRLDISFKSLVSTVNTTSSLKPDGVHSKISETH